MVQDIDVIVQNVNKRLEEFIGGANADTQAKVRAKFQEGNAEILQHLPEIQQTLNLWHDQASTVQYKNYVSFQLLKKIDIEFALKCFCNMPRDVLQNIGNSLPQVVAGYGLKLPQVSASQETFQGVYLDLVCNFGLQQYRYPHWVDVSKGDVFIDCGAYNGVTTMWAEQKGATVYAFEPIPANFELTKAHLEQNGYSSNNCYQYGVGAKNEQLTFKLPKNRGDSAFAVKDNLNKFQKELIEQADTEDVTVQCVRLDDFLPEHNITPSFIKMDIEGAELDALKGASEVIKQHKPKLAICLYHLDSDLWTIPLFLKSLVPEYKFFCRENGLGVEFVLYATVGDKF